MATVATVSCSASDRDRAHLSTSSTPIIRSTPFHQSIGLHLDKPHTFRHNSTISNHHRIHLTKSLVDIFDRQLYNSLLAQERSNLFFDRDQFEQRYRYLYKSAASRLLGGGHSDDENDDEDDDDQDDGNQIGRAHV